MVFFSKNFYILKEMNIREKRKIALTTGEMKSRGKQGGKIRREKRSSAE